MCQPLSGLDLLIVEDNGLIQFDLQLMFEEAGARVQTAWTVKEASQLLDGSFDAGILDINLPDGDVRPIAESFAQKNIPVVFYSGIIDQTPWVGHFPHAVALSKPASTEQLLSVIQDVTTGFDGDPAFDTKTQEGSTVQT